MAVSYLNEQGELAATSTGMGQAGFRPENFAQTGSYTDDLLRPAREREEQEARELATWRDEARQELDAAVLDLESFQPGLDEPTKRRAIIRRVMDAELDMTPRGTWTYQGARSLAAQRLFPDIEGAGQTDEAFFGALQARASETKETREFYDLLDQQAVVSALRGVYQSGEADTHPARQRVGDRAHERFREVRGAIEEQYGEVLPMVRDTFRLMEAGEDWVSSAAQAYESLDEEEQTMFLEGLRELAMNFPSPEVESSFAQLAINYGLTSRGVSTAVRNAKEGASETLAKPPASVRVLGDVLDAVGFGGMKERNERAESDAMALEEHHAFLADVRSVFEEVYDPIRPLAPEGSTTRAVEEGLYAIPGAIATTGIAAIPGVGLPLTFEAMRKSSENDYRARFLAAGMDRTEAREKAKELGIAAAVPQMLMERLQARVFFGKMPVFDRVAGKLDGMVKNRLARVTSRFALAAAGETAIELGQDLVHESVQALAAAFDSEIPDIEWSNGKDGVFDGYFNKSLTTLVAVAPLAIFGAVGGISREKRAEVFARASDVELLAAGAKPEAVAKVREARGPAEMVRAVDDLVKELDPQSETAKEASEALAAEIEAQTALENEAVKVGAMPGVRMAAGREGFEVYDSRNGETIATVETADEATRLVWAEMGIEDRAGQHRLDALVSKLEAGRLLADETGDTVEVEESRALTTAQAVEEFVGSDTRIARQLELLERADGGTGGVSRIMTGDEIVSGVSLPPGYRERREAVQRLFNGSSIFTLVHERSHRKRRELMESGEFTRDEQIQLFQKLDSLLEGRTATTGPDAVPQSLRFLPASDTVEEVHLDEAFSKLAEVMLLRTVNREKSRLRKLLNENLRGMVLARVPGASKLFAFVRGMREFFGLNLARAAVLKKAEREGRLDSAEMERLGALILGVTPQEAFESDVIDIAEGLVNDFVPTDDVPFSIGDAAAIDSLIAEASKRAGSPETRAKVMGEVSRRLQELKREAGKIVRAFGKEFAQSEIVDPRTVKSLRKEAAMRQALRQDELEEEILQREGRALAMGDALPLKEMPVHGFIARPGKKIAGGQMESRTAFMRRTGRKPGAEYEGSEGMLGGLLYGGSRSPDQMAQELYEEGLLPDAEPATMWARLAEERVSVAEMRDQFEAAKKAVRGAKTQAKEEADQWLAEALAKQKRDHNPVARIRRSLAMLDAILLALPAELRGRVGGFVQLAKLNSDEKRLEFLQSRIEKLDKVLEAFLKKEFTRELAKVREKASAKRESGKKPKGKLGADGHRFFDQVEAVAEMGESEVLDLVAGLEKQLTKVGEAETIDLAEKIQIAHTFGNLSAKSAQEIEAALKMALGVYRTKRNSWRIQEEARLGNVRSLVAQTIEALGNPDTSSVQVSKDRSAKAFQILKNGAWDLVSFAEVMDNLFGRGHELAKLWGEQARKAFAARTKGITAAHARWSRAIEQATGLKGRAARERVWEMQTKQTVKAVPRPEFTSTVKIPIDTFFDSEKRSALGLSKRETEILTAQFEALPKGSRKKNLTLTRTAVKPEKPAVFTESEAVYLTMLWRQDDYRSALTKHGFGEEFQRELEEGLSEAAKDLREHLATEYAESYEPLRKLFAQMFGIDLPQVDHYQPGRFYSTGEDVTMNAGGEGFVEGGFQQGFLKDRKSHTAEPRAESAFSVFFNHLNQTEHWKALAPLSRELRGVFGNPKVKKALEARSPEASAAVNDWLKAIDGNGFNNPRSNKILEALMTSQAYLALAWKLSTIVKNFFGAAINGVYRMPVAEFVKGYGRLMTGRGSFKKLFESDLIQQRLAGGFAPEVRAAISKAFGSKPTRRAEFLRHGMEVIGLADGLGTAMGAAVTYDYHLRKGLKAGLARPRAEAVAMAEAAETISRTAQPVEITDRSLAELRLHGLGKIAFVFASEARQKSALWLMAWGNTFKGKATKEDLRVLFISHFVMAPLMHTIGTALRDARDDDDDEVFDDENWGWEGFAKSVAVGPLSGLPLVRDVFDGFNGESGPLKRLVDSGDSLVDLLTDDPRGDDLEWYERKITKVLQGLDAFTAVSASVFDQVFDLVKNFSDDQ